MATVNPDLAKERENASFTPSLMTYVLDGGPEKTLRRRYIEHLGLSDLELADIDVLLMSSRDEKFTDATRRSVAYVRRLKELNLTNPTDIMYYTEMWFPNELWPMALHRIAFINALPFLASQEQLDKWHGKAKNHEIIGNYAQTELGHGTNVRALETTATFDKKTKEFVMNSPTVSSIKWLPGNLGKSTNFSIVMAQLIVDGRNHGLHSFLVQIRDLDTHQPLPGITVGDIGPTFGGDANDNGFLKMDNVRIPMDQMLSRNQKLREDGSYVRSGDSKLVYGSMVRIRAELPKHAAHNLSKAATIVVRYSCVRRQSELKPGEVEPQILDFQTQQYRVFPAVASAYAFRFASQQLWDLFGTTMNELAKGETGNMQELHVLSCALKAYCCSWTSVAIEKCRLACGGHGYSHVSGLPEIFLGAAGAVTAEGEHTVLYLQAGRYLLKSFMNAQSGKPLGSSVAYLSQNFDSVNFSGDCNLPSLLRTYQQRAKLLVTKAATRVQTLMQQDGQDQYDAWNMSTVCFVKAAMAYSEVYILKAFIDAVQRQTNPAIKDALNNLCLFHALYGIIENAGDFLQDGYLTADHFEMLEERLLSLLDDIRRDAVAYVDAFDFTDRSLTSILGRYDGNVYENMYKWALKSPLNKTQVHETFHKYLKPLREAKL